MLPIPQIYYFFFLSFFYQLKTPDLRETNQRQTWSTSRHIPSVVKMLKPDLDYNHNNHGHFLIFCRRNKSRNRQRQFTVSTHSSHSEGHWQ